MGLIDFLLNLAGLLLWLNWRSAGFDPLQQGASVSLVNTLRRTDRLAARRWQVPGMLLVLLVARAFVYWHLGTAGEWSLTLSLGVITVPFRSDRIVLMLLYSGLSFGVILYLAQQWILFLSALNRRTSDLDQVQRFIRIQLGRLDRWPALAKLVLPVAFVGLVWPAVEVLLASLGLVAPARTFGQVWQQGVLLGIGSVLSLKLLIGGYLALHLVNSYVYLGNHAFWEHVNTTSRRLLWPLSWLPLRFGKMDFLPLAGMILVFVLAELAERGLTLYYNRLPF